jgi:alpha-glucosidase
MNLSSARFSGTQRGGLREALPTLRLCLCLLSALGAVTEVFSQPLRSPDGRIQVAFHLPAPNSTAVPSWSASFQGKVCFTNCELSLQTAQAGELMSGVRLVRDDRRSRNERIQVRHGRSSHAEDHFNEARLQFATPGGHRTVVVFRCYNDAIALRYELPADGAQTSVTITNEATSFCPTGDPIGHIQYLENFKTSHEHNVTSTEFSRIRKGELLDMPLTLAWKDGTYAAITEAALRRYAGMALMRGGLASGDDALVCQLTPRADGSKVLATPPLKTPWRVVLLADRPGVLLESSTLYCLNSPSEIGSTSWIQPGKITFHWWNGDVYDGQPGTPMLSFAMNKRYIDFCSREGIPTHSITSTEGVTTPWYHQSKPGVEPGPDTDVTRPRPDFDLKAIQRYADSKNIRLWTWVHQAALRGRVEEAFAAFQKQGWSGMMVDFFDHDDQDSVEFAESILKAAAEHKLLIQLHGIWKPTGLERTFPNLMNHEGALNLEYLKWSDRCTPEHNLKMAFTRLVAGRMDYHLGGFRAVPRQQFQPKAVAPNVLGTRGHHLAMYVCFDNPNPMVADYPTAYEGQVGFDFLKTVPTWWDETRVLMGQVGEVLVTARRKGRDWYLGGMSAGKPRDLEIPLGFLGKGSFEAEIWKDANDTDTDPNHLVRTSSKVSKEEQLRIRVALDGGFVAKLSPSK